MLAIITFNSYGPFLYIIHNRVLIFMSWLISIDESGNLGRDTRFFTMSAIIIRRANHLKSVHKIIPKTGIESKFYNTSEDVIASILKEFATCDVRIVYMAVDKHNYKSKYYGNNLYKAVLSELLDSISDLLRHNDLRILLDRSSFISIKDAKNLAMNVLSRNRCTLISIDKKESEQSPCIQIADYIAGTVFRRYEYENQKLFGIIEKKIVVARVG